MSTRLGTYITQNTVGESYRAYLPPPLPPKPEIDMRLLYPLLEQATQALAELNSVQKIIPNPSLFIYMYVRKEALLSSQIEGTQSSLSDLILFEHQQKPDVAIEDVEEVSHYVKAMYHGLQRLQNNFPLSLRLLKEIHAVLLSGTRGFNQSPGEFRRTQNWLGGTRPGNALFVPPPAHYLNELLGNLELFLHDTTLPTLIKAGIAHVQFETIHPFLDGNGRLGRLLIILLLCEQKMLHEPILYISLYLKQNRNMYYQLLQEMRLHGHWETWLEFFLNAITFSAQQATQTIHCIHQLFEEDAQKINALGRMKFSCHATIEHMKQLPQITASLLAKDQNMSLPSARHALNQLTEMGILQEITGKKRDKIYVYRKYLDLLEFGTEPL